MSKENQLPVRALLSEDRYWELGEEGIRALRAEEAREASDRRVIGNQRRMT